ncbi:pyridoxal phosphate phosphatase PHOSPHO2 [Varanus komodoensis]|nr:pyridoxal phosphate phosphatase PHOSPHO2 [Varanus komodoensis]XP_044273549.1 pyridoxal phosphate phosphatase PHOSPHO2 [Varanus komodoensis]XP_044273551.1 pyridoxal phosphate phosphatase PHOSPHO2 [Varanus komodoensis]XP_044273552.1 pyridoxal phosphate phosphatase PHOSPHO2 [Varanus komodoensis]XP_044273553.1 pyridoxal phosphate phosphatase PHOSPHO2 [Varanus komodoensis]
MKVLLVFDFDHTIVDENSDTWIVKCAPGSMLPDEIKNSYQKGHWTEYMGRVFRYLGDNGIREEEMKKCMTTIPFTAGMKDLLDFIGKHKVIFDCIIISDSNAVFIDWILEAANVCPLFDEVFTNPAGFDDCGYLTVQNHHAHDCTKCPINLCKRKVLEGFLENHLKPRVKYSKTIYIGDGGNDLCPVRCLKKSDVIMPRHGYILEKMISKLSQNLVPVEASVVVWSSGTEILDYLELLIKG